MGAEEPGGWDGAGSLGCTAASLPVLGAKDLQGRFGAAPVHLLLYLRCCVCSIASANPLERDCSCVCSFPSVTGGTVDLISFPSPVPYPSVLISRPITIYYSEGYGAAPWEYHFPTSHWIH